MDTKSSFQNFINLKNLKSDKDNLLFEGILNKQETLEKRNSNKNLRFPLTKIKNESILDYFRNTNQVITNNSSGRYEFESDPLRLDYFIPSNTDINEKLNQRETLKKDTIKDLIIPVPHNDFKEIIVDHSKSPKQIVNNNDFSKNIVLSPQSSHLQIHTISETNSQKLLDSNNSISNKQIYKNKHSTRKRDSSDPIPERPVTITRIFSKSYFKDINQVNLYKFKYHRIRKLWNTHLDSIKKTFKNQRLLPEYKAFLAKLQKKRKTNLRLELNKKEYMIHYAIPDFSRSGHRLNVFEKYVINFLFEDVYKGKQKDQPLSNLLESYLYRSGKAVRGNYKNNLKGFLTRKNNKVLKAVIPKVFGCMSQELMIKSDRQTFRPLDKMGIGVIRFSFCIDVYLLKLFYQYKIEVFVIDPRLVIYLYNCLKENESPVKLDELRHLQFKKKKFGDALKRLCLDSDVSKVRKIGLTTFLGKLERLIVNKQLLKKEGITRFYEYEPLIDEKELKQQENKSDNTFRKKTSGHNICNEKVSNTHNKQSNTEDDDCVIITPLNEAVSINSYLGKRPFLNDPIILGSSRIHNQPNQETENLTTRSGEITFYDFGVSFLKSIYDFSFLRIEEISDSEKTLLKSIIDLLILDNRTKSFGQVLYQVVTFKPASLKEYLRNLELFFEYINRIGDKYIPQHQKLKVIHLLQKVRSIIFFLEKKFFEEQGKMRNSMV